MVAVTVVMAGVLYVLLVGTLAPPPKPPAAIILETIGWDGANNTAQVLTATGVDATLAAEATFVVRDAQGTPYFGGSSGDTVNTGGVDVTVTFVDLNTDNRFTAGDKVVVHVDPESATSLLDGGILEIHSGGQQLSSHAIA